MTGTFFNGTTSPACYNPHGFESSDDHYPCSTYQCDVPPAGTEKTAAEIKKDLNLTSTSTNISHNWCKPLVKEGFLIQNPDKSYQRNTASSANAAQGQTGE